MTNEKSVILRTWTKGGLDLASALAACAQIFGDAAVCLAYSPVSAEFSRVRRGTLRDGKDKVVDLAPIFEARVFSATGELRWLKDPHSIGRSAYVSQETIGPGGWDGPDTSDAVPFDRRYLLWGSVTSDRESGLSSDWCRLRSPRIGGLNVPWKAEAGQRLVLTAVEYIGEAASDIGSIHGNQTILDERLVGIEMDGGTRR